MSGNYGWNNGNSDWGVKNGYGYFWSSTPYAYAGSYGLHLSSTNVNPKHGGGKPNGFTLRCVAQFFTPFLPELSAAFLFRL